MSGINSVDDFLNHSTTTRVKQLNSWKKDGAVDVWNHTKCYPIARWKHGGIPRSIVLEDRDTKEPETRVWSGEWVCHEDEAFLKQPQFKRYNGLNCALEPHYCPLCRLADVMYELVTAGRIDWLEPVFKFKGDIDKETVVLHAGGIFMTDKAYGDLDPREIKRAKNQEVYVGQMWKERGFASADYISRVVDNAHPENGVQVATTTVSLVERFKDVIGDRRKQRGPKDHEDYGDPFKQPYAVRWEYNKDVDPQKMYRALAMPNLPLTSAISSAIYGEAPDVSKMVMPFNVEEMRAYLESKALIELPWDRIFDVRERIRSDSGFSAPRPSVAKARVEPEEAPRPSKSLRPKARAAFPEDDDEKAVECEVCKKAMWEDDTECPHCDARYTASGKLIPRVEEPPPAPKPLRKRSEVVAEKAAEPKAHAEVVAQYAKAPPFPQAPAPRTPEEDSEEDDDPLPFIFCEMNVIERWQTLETPKWLRF